MKRARCLGSGRFVNEARLKLGARWMATCLVCKRAIRTYQDHPFDARLICLHFVPVKEEEAKL